MAGFQCYIDGTGGNDGAALYGWMLWQTDREHTLRVLEGHCRAG